MNKDKNKLMCNLIIMFQSDCFEKPDYHNYRVVESKTNKIKVGSILQIGSWINKPARVGEMLNAFTVDGKKFRNFEWTSEKETKHYQAEHDTEISFWKDLQYAQMSQLIKPSYDRISPLIDELADVCNEMSPLETTLVMAYLSTKLFH